MAVLCGIWLLTLCIDIDKYFYFLFLDKAAKAQMVSSTSPNTETKTSGEKASLKSGTTPQPVEHPKQGDKNKPEPSRKPKNEQPKSEVLGLSELSTSVVESLEAVPSAEETKKYLEDVALRKKRNAEINMLNIIDEIIDLTTNRTIGQAELDTDIPDTIIAKIHEGDFCSEYIHASITKKWAENKFQSDNECFSVSVKSATLIEILDKETQTFHLFGLFIQYSATNKRNRISPEFIAKGECVEAKPRQVGSYSTFRGSHSVKRPLIPVLPTIQPSPNLQHSAPKVSKFY